MCHPIPTSSTDKKNPTTTTTTNNNKNSPTGFQFLWASERSGYRQLYLYQYLSAGSGDSSSGSDSSSSSGSGSGSGSGSSSGGNTQSQGSGTIHCLHGGRPVGGGGTWIVESIEAIDVERGLVYFSGNPGNHTEKHLLVASYTDTGGGDGDGGNSRGGNGGGSSSGSSGRGDSTVAMEITGEQGQQTIATGRGRG